MTIQSLTPSIPMMPQNTGSKAISPDVIKAAREFEAVFVSQMLGHMFTGIDPDPMFGGGEAEETWRSMMTDEYGKRISQAGGIGLSDSIVNALIEAQENAQ